VTLRDRDEDLLGYIAESAALIDQYTTFFRASSLRWPKN
jgi:hypothetical protein